MDEQAKAYLCEMMDTYAIADMLAVMEDHCKTSGEQCLEAGAEAVGRAWLQEGRSLEKASIDLRWHNAQKGHHAVRTWVSAGNPRR